MTIIGADSDRNELLVLENSLRSVFTDCDIVTFSDAMSTYKYCVNHKAEISAAFIPVILRPFDGLKLYELLTSLPVSIDAVFTLREKSDELIELVTANGVCRYMIKPVTPEKVAAVANDMVADCWPIEENCGHCRLVWCEHWANARKETRER